MLMCPLDILNPRYTVNFKILLIVANVSLSACILQIEKVSSFVGPVRPFPLLYIYFNKLIFSESLLSTLNAMF